MRVFRRFAVDQHGRPSQLPPDQSHRRGQSRADAEEPEPEQRQEGDGDD